MCAKQVRPPISDAEATTTRRAERNARQSTTRRRVGVAAPAGDRVSADGGYDEHGAGVPCSQPGDCEAGDGAWRSGAGGSLSAVLSDALCAADGYPGCAGAAALGANAGLGCCGRGADVPVALRDGESTSACGRNSRLISTVSGSPRGMRRLFGVDFTGFRRLTANPKRCASDADDGVMEWSIRCLNILYEAFSTFYFSPA